MRRDLVYRDEIMDSLVKEYNRKRTNDGLKLAWIEKAVNDVKPAPHWIPVEQALPELRHDVLLTVFFHERWNVAEGYRQDGEFMFWNNGRLDSVLDEENRVIAWMPKPEPARR